MLPQVIARHPRLEHPFQVPVHQRAASLLRPLIRRPPAQEVTVLLVLVVEVVVHVHLPKRLRLGRHA
jgi:hypothetical protein